MPIKDLHEAGGAKCPRILEIEGRVGEVGLALLIAFLYLELIYKSFQDVAIQHNSEISHRIDLYLANTSDSELLTGYRHSFGSKLKYPSVPRVFGILLNRNRWHILNFYILLALFSVGAFVVSRFVT